MFSARDGGAGFPLRRRARASFQAYAKLGSALRQFRFELGLQNLDFCRQCRDFGIHRKLPVAGSLKHSTRGVAFFVGFTAIKQHRLRRTVSSGKQLLLDLVRPEASTRSFASSARLAVYVYEPVCDSVTRIEDPVVLKASRPTFCLIIIECIDIAELERSNDLLGDRLATI